MTAVTVLTGCASTSSAQKPPASSAPSVAGSAGAAGPSSPAAGSSVPDPPLASRTSPEPPGRDDHGDEAPSAPKAAAPKVALAYARVWVRGERTPQQWLAAVRPLCEPGFAKLMATVDPANVPASRVTGAPVAVAAPVDGSVQYRVPTDAGTLTVTLTSIRSRWLVSANDFTSTP